MSTAIHCFTDGPFFWLIPSRSLTRNLSCAGGTIKAFLWSSFGFASFQILPNRNVVETLCTLWTMSPRRMSLYGQIETSQSVAARWHDARKKCAPRVFFSWIAWQLWQQLSCQHEYSHRDQYYNREAEPVGGIHPSPCSARGVSSCTQTLPPSTVYRYSTNLFAKSFSATLVGYLPTGTSRLYKYL
jgi:hypothetical protein